MDETHKMLRAIINGQSSLKQELLSEIRKVDKKLEDLRENMDIRYKEIANKIDRTEKSLTERLNRIGRQVTYLEEDAPTREEFDQLEDRVVKLERKSPSN